MQHALARLAQELDGAFFTDQTMRTLYATDASAYREMPLASCRKTVTCFLFSLKYHPDVYPIANHRKYPLGQTF